MHDLAERCCDDAFRVALRYNGGSHIRGALAGFAATAVRGETRDVLRAARLLGAIANGRMVYAHRRASERIVAASHIECDAAAWQNAYAEGRRMTFEQAITYALREDNPA